MAPQKAWQLLGKVPGLVVSVVWRWAEKQGQKLAGTEAEKLDRKLAESVGVKRVLRWGGRGA